MYDLNMTKPGVAVKICRTTQSDASVALPVYETDGAAGMDVRANLAANHRDAGMTLAPGARAIVPTGLSMEIPSGYEIQVRPRSGLAVKSGITVINTPGTVDADYRGEVGVILINLGETPFVVLHGERIAQFVLAPVSRCEWIESDVLSDSNRGSGGFGSTGA